MMSPVEGSPPVISEGPEPDIYFGQVPSGVVVVGSAPQCGSDIGPVRRAVTAARTGTREPISLRRRLDARVPAAHASCAPLPPLTSANGWRATGSGGSRDRLGTYGNVGNEPLTRVGRDHVCKRMPFLQATSGHPAEGTMVTAGPAIGETVRWASPNPVPVDTGEPRAQRLPRRRGTTTPINSTPTTTSTIEPGD